MGRAIPNGGWNPDIPYVPRHPGGEARIFLKRENVHN
jgi:hypothetical protein